MHQLQSLTLYLLDDHAENPLLSVLVFGQKHQTCAILAFLWHWDALQKNELMWYLQQDASTIAILANLCTTMTHIFQHTQSIVHQLMTFVAVDIHNHTHTTCIMFILTLIKPILLSFCHNIIVLSYILGAKL